MIRLGFVENQVVTHGAPGACVGTQPGFCGVRSYGASVVGRYELPATAEASLLRGHTDAERVLEALGQGTAAYPEKTMLLLTQVRLTIEIITKLRLRPAWFSD